jgi:hypothetical protein
MRCIDCYLDTGSLPEVYPMLKYGVVQVLDHDHYGLYSYFLRPLYDP